MSEYEQLKLRLIEEVHKRDPGFKKEDLKGFDVDQLRILLSSLRALDRNRDS